MDPDTEGWLSDKERAREINKLEKEGERREPIDGIQQLVWEKEMVRINK